MTLNKFNKGILILLFISFLCVTAGTIQYTHSLQLGTMNNSNQAIILVFVFCLMVFLIIWKVFYWLDNLNEKKCLFFSLLIILTMSGLFTAISFSARVTQLMDSIDVMDTALYLRTHAEATEAIPFISFVGRFGNNYPVILLESYLIKIITWLGFRDVEIALNHLNVVVLMTAVVFTWLIVKETRGIKTAAKALVVCLLNPYLYFIVNWTYSMTYSLPLMMGILYILLRLKKARTIIGGVALAFIEGIFISVGFLIRPTAIFLFIAAILVWLPRIIQKKINKRRVLQIICVILVFVFVFLFVSIRVDRRFGSIKQNNLPLSFWLLMGSHEDGMWNQGDFDMIRTYHEPSEQAQYAINQTIFNYIQQGLTGTLNLWYRKLNNTWADGGFFYPEAPVSEGNSLSEYVLGNGTRNQLAKLYSQAFRLFMILGFLLAISIALYRHKTPMIVLVMMVTIFGCVVFHTFWETNARYSIPFILPMLIVVEYGISSLQAYMERKELFKQTHKNTMGIIFMGVLVFTCSVMNDAMNEETTLKMNRISSTANTRVSAVIEPNDCTVLEQDFYVEKPFNSLAFRATLPTGKNSEECSGYELSILNDKKQVLYTTLLTPDLIDGQGIETSFEAISGYQHYYIRLTKMEAEKAPILFYTHYTYGVDPYRGDLIIHGSNKYSSDIMMDVYEVQETTVVSDKVRIILIMLILLLGGVIAFIPMKKKTKLATDCTIQRQECKMIPIKN